MGLLSYRWYRLSETPWMEISTDGKRIDEFHTIDECSMRQEKSKDFVAKPAMSIETAKSPSAKRSLRFQRCSLNPKTIGKGMTPL
jgi:hypothetical protein